MTDTFRPWQLLSVIIAGMLNEQQQIIEYLKKENRILRAQIGNRRLRLSDDDRRRLVLIDTNKQRTIRWHGSTIRGLDVGVVRFLLLPGGVCRIPVVRPGARW